MSSSYFFPDEIMQMLAGVARYHGAVAGQVTTNDQIDQDRYAKAIEEASTVVDPKLAVATAFRDNKQDIIPKIKEYHVQEVKLNVAYSAMPPMKKKFIREMARIVQMPVMKSFANNNLGQGSEAFGKAKAEAVIKSQGNVTYMNEWRDKRSA